MRRRLLVLAVALFAFFAGVSAAHAQLGQTATYEGQLGYVFGAASGRTQSNAANPCAVVSTNTGMDIGITGIPAGATILAAYLYWAGSGDADDRVSFEGRNLTGTVQTGSFTQGATTFEYFGGFANVTARVPGNGTYTLSGLSVDNGAPWCGSEAVVKGWSLLVIYQHTGLPLRRIDVWDGLHVIRNAGGSVTTANFLAAPQQDSSWISVLGWEGDNTITGGESVTFNGTTVGVAGDIFNSTSGFGADLLTFNLGGLLTTGTRSATLAYATQNDMILVQAAVTSLRTAGVDVMPKTGAISRWPGTAYSATFTVENPALTAQNIDLRALRSGAAPFLQLDSISGPGLVGTRTADSMRISLAAGSTATYRVWYTVPAGVGATNRLTFRARLVAYPARPEATSEGWLDVTRLSAADLTLTKSATGTFVQGANGTWRLVVRNVGNQASSGALTVRDSLPAGISYTSGASVLGNWNFSASGQIVTATSADVLAAGDSAIFSITAAIAAAAVPSVTNVAVVSGGGQTNLANDTARAVTPVQGIPDLTLTKTSSALAFAANGTYTLRARNIGNGATTAPVVVTDTLPAGLTYVSFVGAGWSVAWDAPTRVITATHAGAIAAATNAADLVLTVAVGAAAYPSVTNRAWVAGGGEVNTGNDEASATTVVSAADVAVEKTSSASFTVGVNGTYTLRLTNLGNGPTSGPITVRDTLPRGVTYVSHAGVGWAFGAASGTTPDGRQWGDIVYGNALAAGAQTTVTVTVAIAAAAAPTVTNYAHVTGGNDVNPANNSASVTTPVSAPDLQLVKSAPALLVRGQAAAYRLAVRNTGALPSTGLITVVDTLPAELTYVSAAPVTGAWTFVQALGVVTATLNASIAAGDSAVFTINTTVSNAAPTSVTNRAHVSGGGQGDTSNDAAGVTTPVSTPDLTIAKAAAGAFRVGVAAAYDVIVTNAGTGPTVAALVVHDTLPAGLTYVSGSGAGWTFAQNGQAITATYAGPALAAGATTSFSLGVTVTSAALPAVTNRAWVSGGGELNTGNNGTGDVVTAVAGSAAITLSTAVTPNGTVLPGQVLTYDILFTNGGQVPAVDVVVTDTIAPHVQFEIGSTNASLPAGITAIVEYFDGGSWAYTPVSGACAAPAGYDGCITAVRWRLESPLPVSASGTVWFRVRVK